VSARVDSFDRLFTDTGIALDDRPVGRVADVERLLGLLALLRNADGGWVAHAKLRTTVPAYRDSSAAEDGVARMMQRDMESLRNLGFGIEGETHEGSLSTSANGMAGAAAGRS
jgi:hypothetical protein